MMKKPIIKMMDEFNKLCLLLAVVTCVFTVACGSDVSSKNTNNSNSNANATPGISEAERELKSLNTADFDYIFSIKRKDGEAFDSEDKSFLKQKTYKANRRNLTRDEKMLFIGSNYRISDKNIAALKDRFDFEDFSKSEVELKKEKEASANNNANSNGEANKKSSH